MKFRPAVVLVTGILLSCGGLAALADSVPNAASAASELVTIDPCRLADTRPGSEPLGGRKTKLGPEESAKFTVRGSNGSCAIPGAATGIVANVTAVGPSASSFLTVYPDSAVRPLSSSLNFSAGASPTPNQVTVGLSSAGDIRIYNFAGTVDVIIDVVGYYQPATAGPAGPTGPAGATGPVGPTGITGHEVVTLGGILPVGVRDGSFTLTCPAGKKVLGGGVSTFNKDIQITANTPLDGGTQWIVNTTTYSGNNIAAVSAVNLRVVCASVS